MAIHTDDSFRQFLPATQKTEIQIRPVAQVEGGIPDLRGVQSMAAIAADVGRETEALGKALQAQERERQFNSAVADFGIKSLEAELEASKKPYKESVPYLVEQLEKTRSDLAGNITDTKAKAAFSQHAAQAAVPTISRTFWDSRKREIYDNSQQLQTDNDKYLLAFGGGFMTAEQTELLITDSYRKAAKNGLISPEMAETLIEGTKDKIDEIGIQNIKNEVREGTTTPDKAIAIINDPRNFVNIDPVIRQKMIEDVTALAEAKRDDELRRKEHNEDRADQQAFKIQNLVEDDFIYRLNNIVGGQSKETFAKVKLEILKAAEGRKIRGDQQNRLIAMMDGIKDGPDKDDPYTVLKFDLLISEGKADMNTINEILASGGLTGPTKAALGHKILAQKNEIIEDSIKHDKDMIKAVLVSSGPGTISFSGEAQKENTNYAQALKEYDALIVEAKKKGFPDYDGIRDAIILKYGKKRTIMQTQRDVSFTGGILKPILTIEQAEEAILQVNKIPDPKERYEILKVLLQRLEWLKQVEQVEAIQSPAKSQTPTKPGERPDLKPQR